MKCRDYQNLINMLIDGRVSDEEKQRLFEHCQECSSCREELRLAERLDALLSDYLQPVEPPADFVFRVMEALPEQDGGSRATVKIPFLRRIGLAAASFVMVATVAAYGLLSGGAPYMVANDPETPPGIVVSDKGDDNDNTNAGTDQNSGVLPDTGTASGDEAVTTGNNDNNDTPTATDNNPGSQTTEDSNNNAVTDSGEVKLPVVASYTKVWGDFALTLLAGAEEGDVVLPTIDADGQINYLLEQDGAYQLWQKAINGNGEPLLLEDPFSGSITERASYIDEKDSSVAVSPDGTMVASNKKGENAELWLSNNNSETEPTVSCKNAGGGLLSWAPNSSKLVFDDADGNLYVIYPVEEVVLLVFEGQTESVVWSSDSQTLVFTAKAATDDHSKLFKVTLP